VQMVYKTLHDATRGSPPHLTKACSPKCLEKVDTSWRFASCFLGWHHALRSYHNMRNGEEGMKMPTARRVEHPRSGAQVAFGRVAIGAMGLGALAVGATAIGALAIGALAIRALAVKRGRIERLNIEELEVGRLHVRELVVEQEQRAGTS
jgi:hypothetical protein